MVSKVEVDAITLTPVAATAVRELIAQRKLDNKYALRIYVAGRTCAGLQYGMALDNKPRETDLTFETEGVKVLVDDHSILYLRGSKIDFVEDPNGKGFAVENPNETSICSSNGCSGCGS